MISWFKDNPWIYSMILVVAAAVAFVLHAMHDHNFNWTDVGMFAVILVAALYFVYPDKTAETIKDVADTKVSLPGVSISNGDQK
jgi:hypothetical protein